ncbi:DUF2510 domain-containing protein [Streptomyces sp. NP-1717]|uniref:DUF2510 domain-containing protein n=1 Tax=Streptomyces sp. NP-1717 TaxID=2704470 RepID=UPI001F5DFA25|nr:DUF2510 domain-containing protein [Streptomyces sp. NP-1717]MCI3221005.1 DUF2510 domain-containing protein [Streptomyces sp. NP-1717]
MSMTTPPGWYADPGVPGSERWWDGNGWTAHTRPLGGAVPYQQGGQQDSRQPRSARRGRGVVLGGVAAGLVLVATVVAGITLFGDDGTKTVPRSAPTTGEPAPGPTDGGDGTPTAEPSADPTVLVDQLNGITLPIPDDWEKSDSSVDRAVTMTTVADRECPGETNRYCRYGRVMSSTATQTDAAGPEALAKEDIEDASDALYDEDSIGNSFYGGVTSHTVVRSGEVTVAGRTGYLVRWKVETGSGPGGYVQSLAFPSTIGAESLIVVRFAFDAGPKGPPLAGMDTITKGIRAIGDTTGGVGSSIGPS